MDAKIEEALLEWVCRARTIILRVFRVMADVRDRSTASL